MTNPTLPCGVHLRLRARLALIAPPVGFALWLTLALAAVPRACGGQRPLLLHAANAMALLVALAAGYDAWHTAQAADAGAARREAFVGLLLAGVFALPLAVTWALQFFVHPCLR